MQREKIEKLVLASLFLALGMVLPLLTGQIKEIGDSLLPMHLVVMLCALICGASYGTAVGAILPFLRSVTMGMPPLYPNAIWMSAELLTYALVIGLLCPPKREQTTKRVLISLLISMIAGRIVWGVAKAILLGIGAKPFTIQMFFMGGFVDAIPGIVLQLILIPTIIKLIQYVKQKRQ